MGLQDYLNKIRILCVKAPQLSHINFCQMPDLKLHNVKPPTSSTCPLILFTKYSGFLISRRRSSPVARVIILTHTSRFYIPTPSPFTNVAESSLSNGLARSIKLFVSLITSCLRRATKSTHYPHIVSKTMSSLQ